MAKRIRQVYKRTSNWRKRKKAVKARTKARWAALEKTRSATPLK